MPRKTGFPWPSGPLTRLSKITEKGQSMSTDQKEAFEDYNGEIILICTQYNIIDLIHEGDYPTKFADCIGRLRPKYNLGGQIDFQEQDLYNIAHETRFAIANTILLFEVGLAPLEIPYRPTVVDIRFFYFVDDAFMRLYNFWNRVANFLNIFFQIEKDPRKLYFTREFLENLSLKVGKDPSLQSIRVFEESEYSDIINKKRRTVVHRESSSLTYFRSFLDCAMKVKGPEKQAQELYELQKERMAILCISQEATSEW
jgi:hypothetical protein